MSDPIPPNPAAARPLVRAQLPVAVLALAMALSSVGRSDEERVALAGGGQAPSGRNPDFARDVYPLLQRSCVECHGSRKHAGELRLDRREDFLSSGCVEPGDAEASELLRRIALPRDDEERMPAVGDPLSAPEIDTIRRWIEQGAVWPSDLEPGAHWSYVAPRRPRLPPVSDPSWPRTPIDVFVLHRLDREGWLPAARASREKLARRLYLDSTGLPPTPEELSEFLDAPTSEAYEVLVDRLLSSPRFGERWARHWLDLARYADSHGFQRDDLRDLWAYRDWVIGAINDDMPFDQFTIEQLAGDLLPHATEQQRVATGFHRCAPTNVEAGSLPEETRITQIIDRVNTTATVWLGSTLECAQCHDHKYDPFTTRDYYRLLAFFNNTEIEADRTNAKMPSSIAFRGPSMPLTNAPRDQRRAEVQAELTELGGRKTDAQTQSAGPSSSGEEPPSPKASEAEQEVDAHIARLTKQLEELAPETTLVMVELPEPRATHVLMRGNYRQPGEAVTAGTPEFLHSFSPVPTAARSADHLSDGHLSSNRLSLARWLVDRRNPLVARVTVNRLWAELFGRGLVSTPEDFGLKGERPSHPELLDWLAVEFAQQGWSIKRIVRTIVLSETYRQDSRIRPELHGSDPLNVLLARGPRFRMDAEMIRDNALRISGLLSTKRAGPSIRPVQPPGVWTKVGGVAYDYQVSPEEDRYRRGIYVILKRGSPYPSFVSFDAPSRMTCTVRRSRTSTPLQALTLLNDPVYVEAAQALAYQLVNERSDHSPQQKISLAFQRCLARRPSLAEISVLENLYREQLAEATREPEVSQQLLDSYAPTQAGAPEPLSAAEFAAWYSISSVLLNLHETITKD